MNFKYLSVSLLALTVGFFSPVILAKGHGNPDSGQQAQVHKQKPSHEKHEKREKHEKHQKKRYNDDSNKQSDADSLRSLERAGERHHKGKHKTGKPSKAIVPMPLPQPPGVNINLPTPPQINIPAVPKVNVTVPAVPKVNVPAPQNPVDMLIDQTANEAKQKAREVGQ